MAMNRMMRAVDKMDVTGLSMEQHNTVYKVRDAYIEVYGVSRWNGLTAKEQHDVVMIAVKDMVKALDRIRD